MEKHIIDDLGCQGTDYPYTRGRIPETQVDKVIPRGTQEADVISYDARETLYEYLKEKAEKNGNLERFLKVPGNKSPEDFARQHWAKRDKTINDPNKDPFNTYPKIHIEGPKTITTEYVDTGGGWAWEVSCIEIKTGGSNPSIEWKTANVSNPKDTNK